jgi:hypothetical protein
MTDPEAKSTRTRSPAGGYGAWLFFLAFFAGCRSSPSGAKQDATSPDLSGGAGVDVRADGPAGPEILAADTPINSSDTPSALLPDGAPRETGTSPDSAGLVADGPLARDTRPDGGVPDLLGTTDVASQSGRADVAVADARPDGGTTDASQTIDGYAQADRPGDAAVTVSATFTPVAIAADAQELTNPLRGQYRWLGTAPYLSTWTDNDSYQRWNWNEFESTQGTYNFALIDNEIKAAKTRHGRFGMRIMPLCQDCATHTYKGAQSSVPDDLAAVSNPLIAAPPGGSTLYLLPDWNSEAYLTRLQAMLNAIGARYKDEPTFAWFDVSSYGNWGEFHLWPFSQSGGPYDTSTQKPITDANARRIVQMNAAAFAGKLLVINSEQQAALAEAVATTSPPIGIRVDCLGADGLGGGQSPIEAVAGALNRWRTAPFITEWCQTNIGGSGADLFVQGAQQVETYHVSMLSSGNFSANPTAGAEATAFRQANLIAGYRLRTSSVTVQVSSAGDVTVNLQWVNDNVAPTYLRWQVVFVLNGSAHIELPMTFDLRRVIDTPVADAETLHPAQLPSGTYQALLRVDDLQAISPPMFLAMQGRDSSGNYLLGSIAVP